MSNVKNKSLVLDSSTSSLNHNHNHNHHISPSSSVTRPKSMGNLIPSVASSSSHNNSQLFPSANYFNQPIPMNGNGVHGGNRYGAKRSATSECSPSSSCSSSKSCTSSSSIENTSCSASSCECKHRSGPTVTRTNSWRSSISTTTISSTTTALSSSCSGSSFVSSCSNPSSNSNSVDDFDDEASVANRLRSKRIKYDTSSSSSYNDGSGYTSNDLSSVFSTTDLSLCGSNSHSSEVSSTSSNDSQQRSMSMSKSSTNSSRPITRNNSRVLNVDAKPLPMPSRIDAELTAVANNVETIFTPTKKTDPDALGKKCLWYRCNFVCDENSKNLTDEFIEHVKQKHIQPQKTFHKYRCLWSNCSVYGQASLSRTWLERHVIDHVAKCPYPCIFNGCNRRFRTEMLREKHVQSHINSSQTSTGTTTSTLNGAALSSSINSNTPVGDSGAISSRLRQQNSGSNLETVNKTNHTPVKPENKEMVPVDYKSKITHILKTFRRRKANASEQLKRFRKANYKDFFDVCSLQLCTARLQNLNFQSGYVTFRARIVASNINSSTGVESYLVEWEPKNIIDSEWTEKSKLTTTKKLSLDELAKRFNKNDANPFYRRHRFRQNKRK